MKERPILLSGPMVRASLAGRKSQTRRVVKPQPASHQGSIQWSDHNPGWWIVQGDVQNTWSPLRCPYGVPGDRLWVRENGWERPERTRRMMLEGADTWERYYYDADGEDGAQLKEWGFKRRPSIYMPRWACRLVLEVTAVRVERLQEISQEDVFAEGLHNAQQNEMEKQVGSRLSSQDCYRYLWDSLNAKRATWSSNPWVWVIEFTRLR